MANILSIISRNTSPGLKRTADTKPDIYIMRVDADPSAGDGTEAPTGSIAIYDAPGGTAIYYKYDNLDTSWRAFLDADGFVGVSAGETDTNISDFNGIITVDPAGFGDYTTITDALAAASGGGTILVAPGTYDLASGETFPLVVPSNVTVQGISKDPTKVVVSGVGSASNCTFHHSASVASSLKNMKVIGPAGVTAGVLVDGLHDKTLFENVIFDGTPQRFLYVVSGASDQQTHLIDCMYGTGATNHAFYFASTISDCLISRLRPYSVLATATWNSLISVNRLTQQGMRIHDSLLIGTSTGGKGVIENTNDNVGPLRLYNCIIKYGSYGVDIASATGTTELWNCIFESNTVDVQFTSAGTIHLNNTPFKTIGGTPGILSTELGQNTIFCTPGTSDDYPNLTQGIAIANTLSTGTYDETKLILSQGTFNLSDAAESYEFDLPAYCTIEGAGYLATEIVGDGTNHVFKCTTSGNDNLTFKNMHVNVGNQAKYAFECTSSDNLLFDGVMVSACDRGFLLGAKGKIINCYYGANVDRFCTLGSDCIISNCHPYDNQMLNLQFTFTSTNTIVQNCTIQSVGNPALSVNGDNSFISNCTISSSTGDAMANNQGGAMEFFVTGCKIISPLSSGVRDGVVDHIWNIKNCLFDCALDINLTASNNVDIYVHGSSIATISGTPRAFTIDDGAIRTDAGATVTVTVIDEVVLSSYSATGLVTVNLPSISSHGPKTLTIKDSGGNAGSNNITINRAGADTIDGATSATINTNYGSITFVKNGTEWSII